MGQPASRIGDMHTCPMVTPGTPPVPHVGGPVTGPGVPTVLVGGSPQAVVGDLCTCVGPPDSIVKGELSCIVAGRPAARMGDNTAHGGVLVMGLPTVLIGMSAAMAYVNTLIANGTITLTGTQDFQDTVTQDLTTIAGTDSGRATLEEIEQSGQNVEISDWDPARPGNMAGPNSRDAYPPPHGSGNGTGTRIWYNPNQPNRPPGSPAVAGLNHELGHASHNATGTNVRNIPRPDTTVRGGVSNQEEGNTIRDHDNTFRHEMDLPPRNGHGHLP